jgi:hypothetical protein
MYALGSFGNGWKLSAMEHYDTDSDGWQLMAPMSTARIQHGAAVLCLVDCTLSVALDLSDVECYNEEKNSWEAKAPMSCTRDSFGVGEVGDRLYAAGGNGPNGARSSFESYDAATDS